MMWYNSYIHKQDCEVDIMKDDFDSKLWVLHDKKAKLLNELQNNKN